MKIIEKADHILKYSREYSKKELVEFIGELVNEIKNQNKPSVKLKENILIEIAKEHQLKTQKLDRKEIDYPSDVLEALRKTPIVLLTEKYNGGQFSGIDQYQYKYNGLVYTFVLEGTYIIEAYTENEIN